eukprot:305437_1
MNFSSTLALKSGATFTCTTDSIISRTVVIVYALIYGLLLVFVSIYSFKTLNEDPEFNKKSCFSQFKRWVMDLRKRKSCYIPVMAHLFDQITDISVALQFYEIAIDENKYTNEWAAC